MLLSKPQGDALARHEMSSSTNNARGYMDRIYRCLKSNCSKADYRDFTSTCISLARLIDLAVAKNQKLLVVQELPQLLKKVCEQKDNEMFQPAIMVLLLSIKNAICFGWFSNTEGQELLRLSKELVDFFTGVGGWSPVDSNKASEIISKLMPRFYPLLSLQTIIVALEAKPGYEAMVCDFYVLKKPSASEQLRMFVVRMDNQETSSCLITPNHVNFLVNGKGVEKRSLTSMDVGPQMPSNVTAMLKIGTNLLQIVGDFPGSYLIAIALTTSRVDFSSPLDLQIFNYDGMKTQTDEELVEGPSRVSLLCPISHKRITSPVKGVSCKHHQCFDYKTFMEINSRRPSWRCPYCNRNVGFPDLRLDLQMLKILKECESAAVDVMVSEDGSWKMISNDSTHGTHNPKRDGSAPTSPGDTSAEEGEILLENNRTDYIELSDTEDHDRQQNQEITYKSSAVVDWGGGGDRAPEDRKPDIQDINAALRAPSATGGQMETAGDEVLLAPASIEQLTAVTQSTNFVSQPFANEGGYGVSEGLADRRINRDVSRSPFAIQALPAQTGITSSSIRNRPRSSSQPDSPAHPSGGIYPVASTSYAGTTSRPLQVQLPSFVGIQDGQVLLNTGQPQQSQAEVPETLINTQSSQGMELQDQRHRVTQHSHQQRPVPILPVGQPSPRVSRDHPYYAAARNVNQIRSSDRQQQTTLQQSVRPDSPTLHDASQLWQQARLVQPAPQQLQGHLNVGREEFSSLGLPSVAEGIPLFNQSASSPGAAAANLRRHTSQATPARTPPGQYIQAMSNPLIVSNASVFPRDQRWPSSVDGLTVFPDAASQHPSELVQRSRMRGSITMPIGRDVGSPASALLPTPSLQWMHAGSPQPSRFSSIVSMPGWTGDPLRYTDLVRNSSTPGMNLQSIQTASTLVSDFDNWLDTQHDPSLVQQGFGDPGDLGPFQ